MQLPVRNLEILLKTQKQSSDHFLPSSGDIHPGQYRGLKGGALISKG